MNHQDMQQIVVEEKYTAAIPKNISTMSSKQRCEFLQARMKYLHEQDARWGYKRVAELTGLAESTVRHIITDPDYDTRVSSLQDILQVIGGAIEQDVVYLDRPETLELLAAKDEEIRQLNESITRLTETVHRLRENIDFHVAEAKMKTKVIEKLLSI